MLSEKNTITAQELQEKLKKLLQDPNASTNTVFMNTMHYINDRAKALGYTNGIAWVKAATEAGELTAGDLAEFETSHSLRNSMSHGSAGEITISESRCISALRVLHNIEHTRLSANGTYPEDYPTEKATSQEIEEWFLKGKECYGKKQYEEAVMYYQKAAIQGDARAQNNLAICYNRGEGVAKDMGKAVQWYRKSADQGNPIAQSNLAVCYLYGDGVTKDWAMAVSLYKEAAAQDHAFAQRKLAQCYQFGKGIQKNDQEAAKWYEKAANLGYAPAMGDIGDCYYNGTGRTQDYKKALSWYKKGAMLEDASCLRGLGDCYLNGCGVEKDYNQAVQYYRSAADKKDPFAQGKLGFCYSHGYGVSQNYTIAREWYQYAENALKSALDNGTPEEYYVYAMFLKQLNFSASNSSDELINNWLLKAANQGHTKAIIAMGQKWLTDIPQTEEKRSKARQWLRQAAEAGSAEAMYYMGYSYNGSSSSFKSEDIRLEAVKWYLKAAIWGYGPFDRVTTLNRLLTSNKSLIDSFLYHDLTPNLVDEMRQASEQGFAQASKYLSICYKNGYCVARNMEESNRYFELAAKQGDSECQREVAMRMPSTPKKEVSKPKSETASQSKSKATKSAKAAEESEKAKLLLQAAEKGDAIAQYEIARAYAHGYYSVKQDPQQAFKWYLAAATQKHPQSQYEVALCYENGIGVEKDMNRAYKFYYNALYLHAYIPSDKEKAEINYKLAMHVFDTIEEYDYPYSRACEYLEAAAKLGHEQAKQALPTVRVRKFFERIGWRIKRFIKLFK